MPPARGVVSRLAMLTGLAQRITDHPRRFLIGAALFFVVAVAFGTPVTGLLSAGNADDFVVPSSQSTSTSSHLEKRLGRTLSCYRASPP